ncbi:hypothetical protein MTO96_024970 [Rhipicephalus appendiculatus]
MEYSLGDEVSEFADESLYDTDLTEKPLEEETDISAEARTSAMERAAKTLMKDANESERNRLEKFFESNNEFAERERKTARDFVDHLASFLPRLLHIRSSIEADQELQQFASDYAETLWQQQQQQHSGTELEGTPQHITIVNADGIYLATYSALLLDLKLIHSGYRKKLTGDVPLTEEKFVDEVHGSGVLVYLSATWLSELYQQVLARSLLREAGYEPESKTNLALINLLTDVDGLGSDQLGSRQLSDYRRLERAATNVVFTPHMLAGMKFARHVLTACWDTYAGGSVRCSSMARTPVALQALWASCSERMVPKKTIAKLGRLWPTASTDCSVLRNSATFLGLQTKMWGHLCPVGSGIVSSFGFQWGRCRPGTQEDFQEGPPPQDDAV